MAVTATFAADFTQFVDSAKTAEKALGGVEVAADRVVPSVTNLKTAMGTFDGVLTSMGVHLSPQVRALGELSDVSGKTASQIGLLGTAGLAVGAIMGGWKIGRAVAEFFDLDEAIGNATASLLGWGSVSDEVAGAKMDVLARASQLAGFEVKDMALALALLEPPAKVSQAALKALADEAKATAAADKAASDLMHASNERKVKDHQTLIDAMAPFKAAMGELNSAGTTWQGTLDTIDGTVVEAIKTYLAAGVSQSALATAYGLTDAQVRSVGTALRQEAEEQQRSAAARRDATKAIEDQRAAEIRLWQEKKASKKATEELAAAEAARNKAANLAMGGAFAITRENFRATARGMGKDDVGIENLLRRGYSFQQAMLYAGHPDWPPPENIGPRVPGFAAGVQNFAGGMAVVGEHGPELVNLPAGSDVYPNGSGRGVSVVNHFQIVDNTENIARKVSAAITRSIQQGAKL